MKRPNMENYVYTAVQMTASYRGRIEKLLKFIEVGERCMNHLIAGEPGKALSLAANDPDTLTQMVTVYGRYALLLQECGVEGPDGHPEWPVVEILGQMNDEDFITGSLLEILVLEKFTGRSVGSSEGGNA